MHGPFGYWALEDMRSGAKGRSNRLGTDHPPCILLNINNMKEIHMSNIITDTTPDGEEYKIDLDLCYEAADELLENLFEMEDEVENFDFTAAVFSLFISSIYILSESGWKTEELVREVLEHSKLDGESGATH